MKTMVSDHQEDASALREEERSPGDADVKDTLPTLEEQQKPAKVGRAPAESRESVSDANPNRCRRSLMKLAVVIAGGAALETMHVRATAADQKKLAKSAVKYQDKPSAGKECDDCAQFIAGKTANAEGSCKVVEGPVSPHGYCIAFAAKPRG